MRSKPDPEILGELKTKFSENSEYLGGRIDCLYQQEILTVYSALELR